MLSIARRAFNFEPEREIFLSIYDKRKLKISRLNFENDLSTGLRLILDQISHDADPSTNPNTAVGVVIKKPANTFKLIPSPKSPAQNELESGGFLKSCYLCKKRLSSDDDVYMYMGDQGFCSVECRSRQISMDEAKELEEALDRRILARAAPAAADPSKCPEGGHCETCRLLEDLRQRSGRRKAANSGRR